MMPKNLYVSSFAALSQRPFSSLANQRQLYPTTSDGLVTIRMQKRSESLGDSARRAHDKRSPEEAPHGGCTPEAFACCAQPHRPLKALMKRVFPAARWQKNSNALNKRLLFNGAAGLSSASSDYSVFFRGFGALLR